MATKTGSFKKKKNCITKCSYDQHLPVELVTQAKRHNLCHITGLWCSSLSIIAESGFNTKTPKVLVISHQENVFLLSKTFKKKGPGLSGK